MTIIDGPLTMHHANFAPHPPSAAVSGTRSPVTEVLTCFFASKDSSVDGNAAQLFKVFAENAEGFKAAAGGWIIEDVEYNGEKRKAYAAVLGWESVEAHMKFRDTQIFKDNIHLLRDGPVGMEVHHTKFVEK